MDIQNKIQREIKFRAWDFEEKRFYYFTMRDILHRVNLREILPEPTNNPDAQEWTGLHDKNGKEIYEGDIVLDHYGADPQRKWQVVYENAQFQIQTNYLMCYLHTADCLEVIGNIYSTPDLMEAK